jgi:phospholipase DDHD2
MLSKSRLTTRCSLGSIITWDILEHQIASPEAVSPEIYSPQVSSENLFQLGVSISDSTLSSRGGDQRQNMTLTAYPQLSFRPQNAFFLGSPIAVFLMIRNQHKPLSPEFRLAGCKNVFNIFHPFDPVAYRIEPLIDRTNADMEPRIVTHWNGGFRVQYQTKRIWKRIVDETYRTQQVVVEMVEHHMTGLGLLDSSMDYIGEDDEGDFSDSTNSETPRRPVCGLLNQGRRIDYMLQEKELEVANEYVAALNAHSSYWLEKDLSLFVARQIVRSSLEAAIQDSEENESFLMSPQGSVS